MKIVDPAASSLISATEFYFQSNESTIRGFCSAVSFCDKINPLAEFQPPAVPYRTVNGFHGIGQSWKE